MILIYLYYVFLVESKFVDMEVGKCIYLSLFVKVNRKGLFYCLLFIIILIIYWIDNLFYNCI